MNRLKFKMDIPIDHIKQEDRVKVRNNQDGSAVITLLADKRTQISLVLNYAQKRKLMKSLKP